MADYDDIDPDGPSAEDLERFGDEFITCPGCKSLVYDQAEICQACGHAFIQEPSGLPMWTIAVGAAVAAALIVTVIVW